MVPGPKWFQEVIPDDQVLLGVFPFAKQLAAYLGHSLGNNSPLSV